MEQQIAWMRQLTFGRLWINTVAADTHTVYLVDASIYIFRSWFGLPEAWHHDNGYPINAVYGFSRWLLDFLESEQPHYVAINFDESLGSCFRNQIYDAYKSSRAFPDDALAFQLDLCQDVSRVLGLSVFASDEYEADDLIASQAALCRRQGLSSAVISGDKDLAQVMQAPGDRLWDFGRKPAMDARQYLSAVGVAPEQVAQWQALTGDKVDDIPGVPGVGPKTAAALLDYFGSLDKVLAQPAEIKDSGIRGAARLADKIEAYREQVLMALQLTTLKDDVPLDDMPHGLRWHGPNGEASEFFRNNGLGGLSRRVTALAESV